MLTCNKCKGVGHVEEKLRHHADCSYRWHTVVCDQCGGKGHLTEQDMKDYYDSWRHP